MRPLLRDMVNIQVYFRVGSQKIPVALSMQYPVTSEIFTSH
jgi:hypothetical protein